MTREITLEKAENFKLPNMKIAILETERQKYIGVFSPRTSKKTIFEKLKKKILSDYKDRGLDKDDAESELDLIRDNTIFITARAGMIIARDKFVDPF